MIPRLCLSVLACLALASLAHSQGRLWTVDDDPPPLAHVHFTDVQSAVLAASDGDAIQVMSGDYGGFVIDGKALAVFEAVGQAVRVDGLITVRNLAAHQAVTLRGLHLLGSGRIELTSNQGPIHLEECVKFAAFSAGPGLAATDCAAVTLVHSETIGEPGILAVASSVYVFESRIEGEDGADGHITPPGTPFDPCATSSPTDGDDAVRVQGGLLYLSGSTILGGAGGDGDSSVAVQCPACQHGADGGDGLRVSGGATVHHVDTAFFAGSAGFGPGACANGSPGIAISGATNALPGTGRDHVADPAVFLGGLSTLTFLGQPGEAVVLQYARSQAPAYVPVLSGPWITNQVGPTAFLGILSPSGVLTKDLTVPIGAQADFKLLYSQGFFAASVGGFVVVRAGAPSTLFVVREPCDGALAVPDCNGNGLPDACDVQEGFSADCDGNGVPDECDVQGGASDCDGDGVLDPCEIAQGTATDADGNGVPDSCDARFTATSPVLAPFGTNDPQSHAFPPSPPAAGVVNLRFDAGADLWSGGEYVTADLNGLVFDPLFRFIPSSTCGFDCAPDCGPDQVTLTGAAWNALVAGGPATVSAVGTSMSSCPGSFLVVSIDYTDATLDCDVNGVLDAHEPGMSLDCNANSTPDLLDLCQGTSGDCNRNGVPDECDIAGGSEPDLDANGVPDSCENPFQHDSDVFTPFGAGLSGSFTIPSAPVALAPVTLELHDVADLAGVHRFVDVFVNGGLLRTVTFGSFSCFNPPPFRTTTVVVPADEWNAFVPQGEAAVVLVPSLTVPTTGPCGSPDPSWLSLSISYN